MNAGAVITHSLLEVCHLKAKCDYWEYAFYVIYSFPVFLVAGLVYSIFWMDLHLVIVLVGASLSAGIGIVLKMCFQIPRYTIEACQSGYAMPSLYIVVASFLACHFSHLFFNIVFEELDIKFAIRIALIWIYVGALSYAKIYVGMNTIYDIATALVVGVAYTFLFTTAIQKINSTSFHSKNYQSFEKYD